MWHAESSLHHVGSFYIILFSSLHHVGSFTSYCFLHCITWDLLHHTVFCIASRGIFYIILFSSLHHMGSFTSYCFLHCIIWDLASALCRLSAFGTGLLRRGPQPPVSTAPVIERAGFMDLSSLTKG